MRIKKISQTTQFIGKIVNSYSTKTDETYSANYSNNSHIPIGSGMDYYGSTPPENYLFADGSEISRIVYAALFNIIGTTYGAGDGITTFNLPDKRERISVMYKENSTNGTSGATLGTMGAKGGEFKHTMTANELPRHNHKLSANSLLAYHSGIGDITFGGSIGRVHDNQSSDQIYTEVMGNTAPFNIMQPYLVCNYIIRVK